MSSDSHATITYTLMSSYEVIVNGYFGMPMDPLDPYVQLVMKALPSPDYIPGPEAPPSPDYIPRPEAPGSPDYIPGPEYLEYLPPANDVLPVEKQPLPAAVSPTAESPGYITDLEYEMEPEEEDGDDEKSEGDSSEYLTSRGDDDGDDLSEDDADEEEASMVLMRSVAPSTFILAPRSRTPLIGTPPLLPIPLPTSSFPLPLLLPSTSGSESTPEADMPLRKRARFTTSSSGYEMSESFVVTAARQIRPALTVADSRRAEDRLISRPRRERRYFRTLSTIYATLVTQIEALQRDVSTLQGQQIDDKDRLMRHIQHEHAQRDVAPEDGDSCS
nr:hypothetical protein [Tanacetum cinerariifolium]